MTAQRRRRTNLYAQYQRHGADLRQHLPGALDLLAEQLRETDPHQLDASWEDWLDQAALVKDVREQLDALVVALAIRSQATDLSDRAAGAALGIDGKKLRALIQEARAD